MERQALGRLPGEPYVVGRWKVDCTVGPDYHVAVDRRCYSVPWQLAGKAVDVFVTPTSVQAFHRGERVASHARLAGDARHSTCKEHLAPAHSAVARLTADEVRAEAARVGLATAAFVERLLAGLGHVEQGIRSCLGVLRLAAKHPAERVEAACQRALAAGACTPEYVEQLLKSPRPIPDPVGQDGPGHHGNVRGPGYFH